MMALWHGKPIDQSHRYGRPQAACREPAGSYDKTTRTAICFEHKTQYLLTSVLHIPALWYFGTSVIYPPWFRIVKLVVIPPRFIQQQYLWNIAIQPAVGCYNPWANLRCSGCYPLGEKLLWNRSIVWGVHWSTVDQQCRALMCYLIGEVQNLILPHHCSDTIRYHQFYVDIG